MVYLIRFCSLRLKIRLFCDGLHLKPGFFLYQSISNSQVPLKLTTGLFQVQTTKAEAKLYLFQPVVDFEGSILKKLKKNLKIR